MSSFIKWNISLLCKIIMGSGILGINDYWGRILLGSLGMFCLAIMYTQRSNLNVVVADVVTVNKDNPENKEFVMSPLERGTILMSFYIGYSLTQISSGILSNIYGPKIVLFIMALVSTSMCGVTPIALENSSIAIIFVRIIMGIAQGGLLPSICLLIVNWTPENYRSTMIGIIFPGTNLGNIIAFSVVSGLSKGDYSWKISFYITIGVSIFWCILWFIFITDFPKDNRWITDKEKQDLLSNIKPTNRLILKNIPIKEIFTSKPFWGMAIAHISTTCSIFLLLTYIPLIIEGLYNINVKNQVTITFLVPIFTWLGGFASCSLSDLLIKKKLLTNLTVKKIFNFIGLLPIGLFLEFGTLTSNKYLGIFFILITCFCVGLCLSVALPNTAELAKDYCEVIVGIINTLASIVSVGAILLTSTIVKDKTNHTQWRIAFGIMLVTQIMGVASFTLFGDTNTQSWAVSGLTK